MTALPSARYMRAHPTECLCVPHGVPQTLGCPEDPALPITTQCLHACVACTRPCSPCQERITTQHAVERFRDRLNRARTAAEELRVQAVMAASEAAETRSKFLRVAKKMSVPARMRANAQVTVQKEEAAALQENGACLSPGCVLWSPLPPLPPLRVALGMCVCFVFVGMGQPFGFGTLGPSRRLSLGCVPVSCPPFVLCASCVCVCFCVYSCACFMLSAACCVLCRLMQQTRP
jgi:hypothetical protein